MAYNELPVAQLRKAIEIKERIEALERELNSMLGGPDTRSTRLGRPDSSPVLKRRGRPPGTGGMSAAAKARIAEAQKARWAAYRTQKGGGSAKTAKKQGGGGMRAAGHARIAAAQRARWAAFNKGKR